MRPLRKQLLTAPFPRPVHPNQLQKHRSSNRGDCSSRIFRERFGPRREGGRLLPPQPQWQIETRGSSWPQVQDWAGDAALSV